jgi:hypothetical protein
MTKKQKKLRPQLLLRMIVAGMTQHAMIFAVAGYAAVRSDFAVSHKQSSVGLVKILISQTNLYAKQ